MPSHWQSRYLSLNLLGNDLLGSLASHGRSSLVPEDSFSGDLDTNKFLFRQSSGGATERPSFEGSELQCAWKSLQAKMIEVSS